MSDQTVTTRSNIPIPDPSEITSREIAKARAEMTAQWIAELANAKDNAAARREILAGAIEAVSKRLEHAIARATSDDMELAARFSDKLDALRLLTDERFEGLKIAFREDKIAAATAVAAAFAAQEKLSVAQNLSNTAAITKSEGSTTKELESLDEKIATLKESVASDIRNLEGRLNRGEGGLVGAKDMRTEHRADLGQILLVAGVAISLAVAIAGFISPHSIVPTAVPTATYNVQPPPGTKP